MYINIILYNDKLSEAGELKYMKLFTQRSLNVHNQMTMNLKYFAESRLVEVASVD